MKIDTALNHRDKFTTGLVDLFSSAKIYGSTHDHMLDERQRLLHDDPKWKRVPEWVRSYVRGYEHCMFDDMYRYHLVWMFEWYDKLYYWDDLPAAGHEHYCNPDVHGAHYWKDSLKPFYGHKKED